MTKTNGTEITRDVYEKPASGDPAEAAAALPRHEADRGGEAVRLPFVGRRREKRLEQAPIQVHLDGREVARAARMLPIFREQRRTPGAGVNRQKTNAKGRRRAANRRARVSRRVNRQRAAA